jgi:hypothetical protein
MTRVSLGYGVLIGIVLGGLTSAEAMHYGQHIIALGYTKAEMVDRCREPAAIDQRYSVHNALHRRAQRVTPSYRFTYVPATSENSSTSPSCNPSVARRWWSLIISTCSGGYSGSSPWNIIPR